MSKIENTFLWGRGSGGSASATGTAFVAGQRIPGTPDPAGGSPFWSTFRQPVYRIPAMVITDTGRIVIGADYRSTARDQVAIAPAISYSDDNGKTWKRQVLAQDKFNIWNNGNARIMDQTMFYYKGVIHIIAGTWNGTGNNTNWTQTRNDRTWSVTHFKSSDNGETWEVDMNFKAKLGGAFGQNTWFGGVGNAIITKFGTCVVPVQYSPAQGRVAATAIYTNDGINWSIVSTGGGDGISENSLVGFVDNSGRQEIIMLGRRDPNTPQNKKALYIYQTGLTQFGASWAEYTRYSAKIQARGGSGAQGSAIGNYDATKQVTDTNNIILSYAANYLSTVNNYIRDNITVSFMIGLPANAGTRITDVEIINPKPSGSQDNTFYGGYSILSYNATANKLGIAYEDTLGIKYKDLSHLIKPWLLKGE